MTIVEGLILGVIQGLTEFLPISSSGHLIIARELFGIEGGSLIFEVLLHAATSLAILVLFRKEIYRLLKGFFKFKLNQETLYLLKIGLSMIPVFIVGVFFKEYVKTLFSSGIKVVGWALLLTALLLYLSDKLKGKERGLTFGNAFLIGVAQAFAVIPGLSRSGATISTGLLSGVERQEVAKFSFLMVVIPILGEAFLDVVGGEFAIESSTLPLAPLVAGFIAAFLTGLLSVRIVIALVKRSRMWTFALYAIIVGIISLLSAYGAL